MTTKIDRAQLWLTRAFHFLRWPAIKLQRLINGESGALRSTLPHFLSISAAIDYAKPKFAYRRDKTRLGPISLHTDWISDPEVFQARLDDSLTLDGDCDDYHAWIAACALKINGVERASLLTVIYEDGGHTVALIRMKDGDTFMVNYNLMMIVSSEAQAAKDVAKRYKRRLKYWFAEDWPTLKLASFGHD